jgi:4-aminobutyrate aminotransferase-like enzyme
MIHPDVRHRGQAQRWNERKLETESGLYRVRGVLVVASSQRRDIVKLYPPFVLEREHVDLLLEATESSLAAVSIG